MKKKNLLLFTLSKTKEKIWAQATFFVVALTILCLLPSIVFGQSKVGHVNTQKIFEQMPELKAANAQIDNIKSTYQAQMTALMDEYQKQNQDLSDPTKKYPDAVLHDKQKGNKALAERIQTFRTDANTDIQKQQDELMAPIRKKISEAIASVAKENKAVVILDETQQGVVLFSSKNDDFTDAVMNKLGMSQGDANSKNNVTTNNSTPNNGPVNSSTNTNTTNNNSTSGQDGTPLDNKEKGIMPHGNNKLIGIRFDDNPPPNGYNWDSTVYFHENLTVHSDDRLHCDNGEIWGINRPKWQSCTEEIYAKNLSKKEIIINVSTVNYDAAKESWIIPTFNLKPGEEKEIYNHDVCCDMKKVAWPAYYYMILNIQYAQ